MDEADGGTENKGMREKTRAREQEKSKRYEKEKEQTIDLLARLECRLHT